MDAPKPGDFPIGSVESRAAMRMQLSNEEDALLSEHRVTFSTGEIIAYGPVTFGVGKITEEFFANSDDPSAIEARRRKFESGQESEHGHT